MTFVEACRAFIAVEGELPLPVTVSVRRRGRNRQSVAQALPRGQQEGALGRLALVCDTDMWDANTPAVTTMLRGLVIEEVIDHRRRPRSSFRTVRRCRDQSDPRAGAYPRRHARRQRADRHPRLLRRRCAISPDAVRAQWQGARFRREELPWRFRLEASGRREQDRNVLEQIWARPTCDVNGIIGGYTGVGAKTVIPAKASAKLSFRLVGEQDPGRIRAAFRAFVKRASAGRLQGGISFAWREPGAAVAARIALSHESAGSAGGGVGTPAVLKGSGGSIPIVGAFKRDLGMDSLLDRLRARRRPHPFAEREIQSQPRFTREREAGRASSPNLRRN